MKTYRHFALPNNPQPVAEKVNRYCSAGMCVDTDEKHDADCPKAKPAENIITDAGKAAMQKTLESKGDTRKTGKSPMLAAPYGQKTAEYGDPMPAAAAEPVAEPKDHEVVVHNNERTPFENVVDTLRTVFKMEYRKASDVMYEAHNGGRNGRGVCKSKLTKTEAEALAAAAKKYASTLKNKRSSTLQFSARKM